MDSDQNELPSESSISIHDFNLIWGASSEAPRFRGAALTEEEIAPLEIRKPPTKTYQQIPEIRRQSPSCVLQEVDPLFLTRFCMFTAHVAIPHVFAFVLDFIESNDQTNGNFESDSANSVIRGGLFDETRFVEYQVKMFTHAGRIGLSLDVLDGYAPAIQGFWSELQQALKEDRLLDNQDDDSDFEDSDFLETDDEVEEDFQLDLEQSKFLKLEESPELVHQMFQDLSDPNFMQQTLLLLAWNCQDAQNFQAVTGAKNQAQQLFDTVIACMIATAADFCLPIARCASLLVSQLVESHDIRVNEEQFNVLVKTLVQWTISQHTAQNECKLTSSKEVASILSSQMSKMAPLAANWKDTLQRVYSQAPYDCVRANLQEVVRTY